VADLGRQAALRNRAVFKWAATHELPLLEHLSAQAGLRAALRAQRRVPAYAALLAAAGWSDDPRLAPADRMRLLPVTDKESYVKAFPIEQRCLDGRIPATGIEIDESSGSSGTPFNWVRSEREVREVHRQLSQLVRLLFGPEVFTINAFSMGAWGTGVNVGEAMRRNGMVKSTGPDVDRILSTLEFFGPGYPYLITGYPPFLKHLLDEGQRRGFDWDRYRLWGVVGGEGMSERLRADLERRFKRVYSGYGAADLDIGVAGESPLAVWIRQAAAGDRQLQTALFGDDPRLPMVFQYNPLDYHVEQSREGELIVTINRLSTVVPRIRYNVHDLGGVLGFPQMLRRLEAFGLDPVRSLDLTGQPIFRWPFLYVFGRSDSTIAYMGANIYPEDVEEALFSGGDAARLGDYCLDLAEVGEGRYQPCVYVEVDAELVGDAELAGRLRRRLVEHLVARNRDFRSAFSEDPSAGELIVRLYVRGDGPFRGKAKRIKRRYICSGFGQAP
jgi:phenylacetate-CoA ligase